MNTLWSELSLYNETAAECLWWFMGINMKCSVIVLAVWIFNKISKRTSAAVRHLLWTASLFSFVLLPVFSILLIHRNIPILAGRFLGNLSSNDNFTTNNSTIGFLNLAWQLLPLVIFAVWFFIVLGLLIRSVRGFFIGRQIVRCSKSPKERRLWKLLELTKKDLGINLPVSVRLAPSNRLSVPLTWGWRRPILLLPRKIKQWPEEKIKTALLHELAHVQRSDWLTQILSQVVCIIYWLNPFVWIAAKNQAMECECACDDQVLSLGTKASEYSRNLLEVAKISAMSTIRQGVLMASESTLEARIKVLLRNKFRSRRPVRVSLVIWAIVISGWIFLPLSVINLAGIKTEIGITSPFFYSMSLVYQAHSIETKLSLE